MRQNIPFSMQTKGHMWQRRGTKRGFFLLKTATFLKGFHVLIVKKVFQPLFFTLRTTVGTQLLGFWFILKLLLFLVFVTLALSQLVSSK